MFGYTARDVDCAFKLFPRSLLDDVKLHSTGHTLSPELLIKARRAGYRVAEVRVTHLPRTAGQAKGARLDHIVRSLLELARLRLDLARGPGVGGARAGAASPRPGRPPARDPSLRRGGRAFQVDPGVNGAARRINRDGGPHVQAIVDVLVRIQDRVVRRLKPEQKSPSTWASGAAVTTNG